MKNREKIKRRLRYWLLRTIKAEMLDYTGYILAAYTPKTDTMYVQCVTREYGEGSENYIDLIKEEPIQEEVHVC